MRRHIPRRSLLGECIMKNLMSRRCDLKTKNFRLCIPLQRPPPRSSPFVLQIRPLLSLELIHRQPLLIDFCTPFSAQLCISWIFESDSTNVRDFCPALLQCPTSSVYACLIASSLALLMIATSSKVAYIRGIGSKRSLFMSTPPCLPRSSLGRFFVEPSLKGSIQAACLAQGLSVQKVEAQPIVIESGVVRGR